MVSEPIVMVGGVVGMATGVRADVMDPITISLAPRLILVPFTVMAPAGVRV